MSIAPVAIHTSDKVKFKGCRLEWHFSSILQLGYRPGIAELPLGFGTSVHTGLQHLRDPKTATFAPEIRLEMAIAAFHNAWRSMRCDQYGTPLLGYEDEYRDFKKLGEAMIRNYQVWDRHNTHKVVMVEIPFEVPICDPNGNQLYTVDGRPVVYRGKIDAIEQDEYGYWIVDYKTVGQYRNEEDLYQYLQRDDQTSGYCWALHRVLNLEIRGVIYEQLYKGVPQKPEVLSRPYKGRMLSTNRQQDTTYGLLLEAIHETGESEELYADYLTYLREGGAKKYVRRITINKSSDELDYIGREIYMEAKQMVDPNVDIYHTASFFGCKYCSYKSPCEAFMRGADPLPILEQHYRKTEEHYVDYGSNHSDEGER